MRFKHIGLLLILLIIASQYSEAQNKSKKKKKKGNYELTEKQKYAEADLFSQALIQKQLGNYQEALLLYRQAQEIDPNDAAVSYEISRILLAVGRTDEALVEAEKAVKNGGSNIWYKANFGKISRVNENYDDYVTAYEEIVKEQPNDLNFVYELAFAYQFTGKYEKAISAYDRIEELLGINEPIITQKTDLYAKIGNPQGGINELEKLVRQNPDEPRYYKLLAEYASKHGFKDKAIQAYEKIVEISPDDPYVHISLAEFYARKGDSIRSFEELKKGISNTTLELKTKINLLAGYYSSKLTEKQKKQALQLSEIIREVHKGDPLASTFYASMLYENGDYAAAEPLFREIVNADKGNYMAWEQLLFCDLYIEDYKKLAEDSEMCIDYFPNFPLPYFFAGVGNFQLRDFVKARAFLESGKDFVVNNNALLEQFYSTLGDTYNELKNYEASYNAYEKALKINPANSIVLNNYAYYLSLRSVDLEKAKRMSAKSLEFDPYNSSNLDTYAWILYKMGDYKEALKWIEKAYNNGGNNSGAILEHKGDILFKLNRKSEAVEYWRKAKSTTGYSDLLDKKIEDQTLYE